MRKDHPPTSRPDGMESLRRRAKVRMKDCKSSIAKTSPAWFIRSIPTVLIFKNGGGQERMVGIMRKSELMAKLNAYL